MKLFYTFFSDLIIFFFFITILSCRHGQDELLKYECFEMAKCNNDYMLIVYTDLCTQCHTDYLYKISQGIYTKEACKYIVSKDRIKLGIFLKNYDKNNEIFKVCRIEEYPVINPTEAVQLYRKSKKDRWIRIKNHYDLLPSFE